MNRNPTNMNKSVDFGNQTFNQSRHMNSSFGSRSDLNNKSLIEKSKLDGSIMLDKKRNLKQSRDNVSKNLKFKASLLL